MTKLSYALVFLSGATGLIYQVTWQKYLATLLGSHASSTAAILALFFLFLSLGYSIIGKFSTRIMKNQLGLYGLIEFLIGAYALYSPYIFEFIYTHFLNSPNLASGLAAALPLCASFIAIPTFLMGGTIPVLTQALSSDFEVSGRVHAQIYGINTLGAVLGCVGAGFYLLEHFGLADTLLIAGNINVLIALTAAAIIYFGKKNFAGPTAEMIWDQVKAAKSDDGILNAGIQSAKGGSEFVQLAVPTHIKILPLYLISFLSGFYTFSLENLVMRMAGLAMGSTTYTYTIVVGAFILAIALGSLWLARTPKSGQQSYFAKVQLAALISVVLLYVSIPHWPVWFYRLRLVFQSTLLNFDLYWLSVFIFSVVILIIPIGLVGANLPLLFTLLRSRKMDLSQSVGRLYAVNCLGSTLGAILGGYLLFRWLDAAPVFLFTLVLIGVATLLSGFYLLTGSARKLSVSGSIIVLICAFVAPKWQHADFVPGLFSLQNAPNTADNVQTLVHNFKQTKKEILYSRFDPNTFAAVLKFSEDSLGLYVNGKPDALTNGDHTARAMAALTPMALKPDPVKKVFIIGLGAGLSTGIFSSFKEVEQIDVAEISEGVVNSLPYFNNFNYALEKNRNKVHIQIGDAYKVLISKTEKYDIIACEPSNPWVTGIEKLFTEEFYSLGEKHLSPTGLYVQWFPLFSITPKILKMILYTFAKVFPYHTVFSANGVALTLVGAKQPLQINPETVKARLAEMPEAYKNMGITQPSTVWLNQILTPFNIEAMTFEGVEAHSLFNPKLEYAAGRANFAGITTGLENLLLQAMVLPIDRNAHSGAQYLVDPLMNFVTETSLREALDKTTAYWGYQWVWLVNMAQKKFPQSKLFTNEFKNFADYAFLLGRGNLPSLEISNQVQNKESILAIMKLKQLAGLLYKFRTLIAISERPALSRLLPLIEADCLKTECVKKKRLAVLYLGKRDDVKNLLKVMSSEGQEISSKQIAQINAGWAHILSTYKKIAYDSGL